MMKRRAAWTMLLLGALIVPPGQTSAQPTTPDIANSGNYMYAACKAFGQDQTTDASLENFCGGILHGLTYAETIVAGPLRSCAPPNSTARLGRAEKL